jgi:hypothetical protein
MLYSILYNEQLDMRGREGSVLFSAADLGRKTMYDSDRFAGFTEQVRLVLDFAEAEARRFQHNSIGTEHLLLGLLREGEGVAAKVLANLGVELNEVRSAVEFIIGRGDRVVEGEIGLTPRAEKVIELARDCARRLNHDSIGTEHLLLGLVREGEGIAAGILESWGVNLVNEWQQELRVSHTSDADFVEAVKDGIFQEQIFVFTPKGDVKDLPVGSTPLDFAYRIHASIGDRCAGARIKELVDSADGERMVTRMVPLDYELKSGEMVEIVTSRNAHPTRDWLNFAHTTAARNEIRRYLKTYERPINIQIGRERLDRELKLMGTYSLEAVTEDAEKWLCNECKVESLEDLLAAIGADNIRPHGIAVKLVEYRR